MTIFLSATTETVQAQDLLAPPSGLSDGFEPADSIRPPAGFEDPGEIAESGGMNERGPRGSHGAGAPSTAERSAQPNRPVTPPALKTKARAPASSATAAPKDGVASPGGAPGPMEVATNHGSNDIYGQWAAKKLKNAAGRSSTAPHPLALGYPDHFVVVCEGGCRNEDVQVVYLELRSARGPVYKTDVENTNAETDHVACVGGCYRAGLNVSLYQVKTVTAPAAAGSWLTTTTKASRKTSPTETGGRWYERLNGETSTDADEASN